MGKRFMENILVILIAGALALLGFGLVIDIFVADTIRTEIISATPIRSSTYEVEEYRSKDDPDYDPVYNKTKTVHDTKYYRTVTVEVDGQQSELELGGSVKFLLPGEGRTITLRRDFKGDLEWDHPLRYFLLGVVLSLGGVAVIVSCLRAPEKPANTGKKKKRKKK